MIQKFLSFFGKKFALFTLAILFLLSTTPVKAAGPQPNGIGGTWELQFQDEFDGNSLDLSKWRPNWLAGSDTAITKPVNGLEKSCYDPKQVSVADGELRLTAEKRTCQSWQYASGLIQSNGKFNYTYGYAEARMWLPAGKGLWPAFWTNGQNWPKDGEIDVLEAYGDDEATYHYHYSCGSGDCGPGGGKVISGATSGWHTYAVYWEPGKITWYYDGKEVWKYTTGVISVPHYLIANLGIDGTNAPLPATLRVDYIRVWKPLPGGITSTTTPTSSNPPQVSPSPTPKVSPSPKPSESVKPSPTPKASPSPRVSPSPKVSPTPMVSPSASPKASPSSDSNSGKETKRPWGRLSISSRSADEQGEDTQSPTVEIVSPHDGSIVNRWFSFVRVKAQDNRRIAKIEFYVDGNKKATNYRHAFNGFLLDLWRSSYSKGNHTVKVIVYDQAGNTAIDEITVVKN